MSSEEPWPIFLGQGGLLNDKDSKQGSKETKGQPQPSHDGSAIGGLSDRWYNFTLEIYSVRSCEVLNECQLDKGWNN